MSSLEREPNTPRDSVFNSISDGLFLNAVIQGRDITVQLPREINPALAGPPPGSAFFSGRENELQELTRALSPEREAIPQLISGLPGAGKTEIALQLACRAQRDQQFTGGVLFADVHGYDGDRFITAEQSLAGFLRALAIPPECIPHGLEERSRLFRAALAAYAKHGRRILVIIDNASSTDQVQALLPSDGVNSVLITSRDSLDLSARRHNLGVLPSKISVELLQKMLQTINGSGDVRVTEDPATAKEISQLCGHLPIALQICGALLADFPDRPLSSLKRDLSQAHTRLGHLERGTRKVAAAFDMSYRRLTRDQARLFRLIPINPGADISSAAAAHLADIKESAAERMLEDLARMHLIEPGDVWGRWRLHDLVRLYADSLGRESHIDDQRNIALGRLLDHYIHGTRAASSYLVTDLAPPRYFKRKSDAFRWLEAERSNLVLAVGLSTKAGRYKDSCILASELANFLQKFRYTDDFFAVSYTAAAAANRAGNKSLTEDAANNIKKAVSQLKSLEEAVSGLITAASIFNKSGDLRNEAATLNQVGNAMTLTGRFEEAIAFLSASAELYRASKDDNLEGLALASLGEVLGSAGKTEEAIDAYSDSLALLQQAGDRYGMGIVLGNLGLARKEVGQPFEALQAFKSALEIFRTEGFKGEEAGVLNNLGLTLQDLGEPYEAIDFHLRAAANSREVGDHLLEGTALVDLGACLQSISELERAVEAFSAAACAFEHAGDKKRKGSALHSEGIIFTHLGLYQEAVDAYTRAENAFRMISDALGEGMSLANRGAALRSWGKFNESIDVLTSSVDVLSQGGDEAAVTPAILQLGASLAAAGHTEEAVRVFTRAVAELAAAGKNWEEAKALLARGIALRSLERFDEAAADLSRAIPAFRAEGDSERATMARAYLDEVLKISSGAR